MDMDSPGSRRPYRRSTPLGRARKNFERIGRAAEVVAKRISVWDPQGRSEVLSSADRAKQILARAQEGEKFLRVLEKLNFVPRRKSGPAFDPGTAVTIVPRCREKYKEIYSAKVLGSLRVVSTLKSGEVAVMAFGSKFMVPRSHIERRKTRDEKVQSGKARGKPSHSNGVKPRATAMSPSPRGRSPGGRSPRPEQRR